MLGLPDAIRACLFDLDGVLTDTASVHRKAWKAMFDAYLRTRADRTGDKFVEFDAEDDYLDYIDGKRREDGVRSFLAARGITQPEGEPDDKPSAETVYGLGNRKNELFQQAIRQDGVKVFEGSRRYLEAVTAADLAVAVVSSSSNTREVLEVTGLDKFIRQRVDGVTMQQGHPWQAGPRLVPAGGRVTWRQTGRGDCLRRRVGRSRGGQARELRMRGRC